MPNALATTPVAAKPLATAPAAPAKSASAVELAALIQAKDDLFNSTGGLGEGSKKFFQAWMDAYVAWVRKHAG